MADDFVWKYGKKWPKNLSDYAIEKWCFRNNHPPEKGGLGRYMHFKNALLAVFDGRSFKYNEFADRIVRCFCDHHSLNIWGSAGTGKSTVVAAIAAVYYDCDPKETTVSLYTSSLSKHDLRAFGMIVHYHSLIKKKFPDTKSRYMPSANKIIYDDPNEKKVEEKRGGIFAFGTANADDRKKVNSQSGVHNTYNLRIIDEWNACDPVVNDGLANFIMSGEEAIIIGMANPDDWDDIHGQHSIPADFDKELLTPDTGEWESTTGFHVLHLNALKSPAMTEPGGEKKFKFFPKREQIGRIRKLYGENSLHWYQQVLGFMPPTRLQFDKVLTRSLAQQFDVQGEVVFKTILAKLATFDPASTEGGDNKIWTQATLGLDYDGKEVVRIDRQISVKPKAAKREEYSIALAKEVIRLNKKYDIPKENTGIDASGTDGIADTLDVLWDEEGKVYRCYFDGVPTGRRVSEEDDRECNLVYDRRVTELWMTMRQFTVSGQIKGLPETALAQFCRRKLGKRYKKYAIQKKSEMSGGSPDEADSIVVLLDMVREQWGVDPGIPMNAPGAKKQSYYTFRQEDTGDPFSDLLSDELYSGDVVE